MLEKWTGDAVGKMHVYGIKNEHVAQKMGVNKNYIWMILHGKRNPPRARERIESALDELIKEKEQEDRK